MKKPSLIALILLIAVQLAVPFSMIQKKESILRNGEVFRFKTRPIDPADPFQGRYVRLWFQDDYIPWMKDHEHDLKRNEPIFAIIEVDNDGFVYFTDWSRERPATGHYLKTRYTGARRDWNSQNRTSDYRGLRVALEFNRFYMDEAKAPRAEKLAREATRNTNCWASVRIFEGEPALEDVFAEGQSLRDLAAEKE